MKENRVDKGPAIGGDRPTQNYTQINNTTSEVGTQQENDQQLFQEEMRRCGIEPPQEIIADGEIHRFNPKGRHDNAGWYVFFGLAAAFGDWSRDIKEKWSARTEGLSDREKAKVQHEVQESQRACQEEKIRKNKEAAKEATETWEEASEKGHSEYLKEKKVSAYGIRYSQDKQGPFIAVPMRDVEEKLWNIQRIYGTKPNGSNNKWFLQGGRKKGCFHTIGGGLEKSKDGDPVFVCEGYATGASIYEATGNTVIIAFDAGNLDSVSAAIKEKYPKIKIVITADNDQWKEKIQD